MVTKLCSLLEEKKGRFLMYEKATLDLLICDAEDIEKYITKRSELATEIEGIDEELLRTYSSADNAVLLEKIVKARMDFEQVPSEYQMVFYASQAVRSVAGRIQQSDKQVVERLQKLRVQALESVKKNQNLPKIKKYLTDLSELPAQGSLRNKKV